jgi:hypothetical protein
MKDTSKVRFVSDVDVDTAPLTVRKPFKLLKDNQRRYVRLEITSPVSLKKIKDSVGSFWPDGDSYSIDGHILNISSGGVLVEIDQPLNEGDLVLLRMTVHNVETVDNILGLAKRCEAADEEFYLAGIEFITRKHLSDLLSSAEAETLDPSCCDFTERIKQVLQQYVVREQLS